MNLTWSKIPKDTFSCDVAHILSLNLPFQRENEELKRVVAELEARTTDKRGKVVFKIRKPVSDHTPTMTIKETSANYSETQLLRIKCKMHLV